MPNYRNKSKIVKREELIPPGKLEEGMFVTFRYNSGSDKTPVVFVLHYDRKKKFIEGINLKKNHDFRFFFFSFFPRAPTIKSFVEKTTFSKPQELNFGFISVVEAQNLTGKKKEKPHYE